MWVQSASNSTGMLQDGLIQMLGSCADYWLGCLSPPPNSPIPSRLEWASLPTGVKCSKRTEAKAISLLKAWPWELLSVTSVSFC